MDIRYSAYGENLSPELNWSRGPEGTKSYAVIVEDPDAPKPMPVVHWLLFNIPADVTHLREGVPGAPALTFPKDARQGTNTRGATGYFGPRPPDSDPHHYHFQVFALDTKLDLKPGPARKELLDAMKGHVLAQGEIVGVFQKPANANGS
jgi:Raf kinase inhibitor-like YbhB/YbcL family protein